MGERRQDRTLAQRQALGRRIRALREERGMTQEALAEAAGLQRPVVGFLERAERDFGISHVFDLATALGVPPEDLFTS